MSGYGVNQENVAHDTIVHTTSERVQKLLQAATAGPKMYHRELTPRLTTDTAGPQKYRGKNNTIYPFAYPHDHSEDLQAAQLILGIRCRNRLCVTVLAKWLKNLQKIGTKGDLLQAFDSRKNAI